MKRLISVTSLTGLLTLMKMGMGFIVGKIIAIYIGPSGVALLGQLQGVISIFNGVANAPVSSGIVKHTAQNFELGYEKCAPWWRASVMWVLIFSVLSILLSLCASGYISQLLFNDRRYGWLIILMAMLLPLSSLGTIVNSIINGQQDYKRYVCIGAISVVVSSMMMIAFIVNYGITGALFSITIQSSLIGIVIFFLVFNQTWFKFKYFFGAFSYSHFKSISGYILMMIVSATLMPLALIAVRKILTVNVGWNQTGEWQAVWKISESYLAIVTMALGTYFLPKLSQLKEFDEFKTEIKNTAKIILPTVTVMAFLIFLLKDVIVSLLFTHEFYGAREYFSIQLIGDVVKIVAWLFAYPMLSQGKVKIFVCLEIVFSTSLVVLCFIFVPLFGVHGANLSYLLNYVLYLIVVITNFKRIVS